MGQNLHDLYMKNLYMPAKLESGKTNSGNATHAFNRPAVAFESGLRLMKDPKSRDAAVSIVTVLILTVNGFWIFLNCKMIGRYDPSSMA